MKIVFLGTPDFAVETLDAIFQAGYEIVAVVTTPDKPQGRGLKVNYSAVKKYALEKKLPLLQPEKLKDETFIEQLKKTQATLFVVVAFRMLPPEVFTIPEKGTFNIHASLLPNYRGAAPVHHAIMNGETKTGVTSFFLNKEMDKGDIIAQQEVEIGQNETAGELYDKLKKEGALLAVKTIKLIEKGNYSTISQHLFKKEGLKLAPKIEKEDTLIDWHQTAEKIFNKIRGLAPFPGAYTRIKNLQGDTFDIKCFEAIILPEISTEKPGSITIKNTSLMTIATQNFQISLQSIQFQNKNRMQIGDFLAGFRQDKYTLFLF